MSEQKVLVHTFEAGIEKTEFYIMKHTDMVVIMSYIDNKVDGLVVTTIPELDVALGKLRVMEHVAN